MAQSQLQFAVEPKAFAASRPPRARAARKAKSWRVGPLGFACGAAAADAVAIIVAALGTVIFYNLAFFGAVQGLQTGFDVGLIVAVLVVLAGFHNGGYELSRYGDKSGQFARAFPLWNLASLTSLALAVAMRAISDFPRGGLAVFYVLGLVSLVLTRRAVADILAGLYARGLTSRRRIAIVGFEHEIDALSFEGSADERAEVVCRFALRETESFFLEDSALAMAAIRLARPDDVFVALPWSRPELIESCLAGLMKLPIEVHLGLGGPLRGLQQAQVAHVGEVSGLTLTRRPLGKLQQIEKRLFDIVFASLALAMLSPVLAVVALLIRWESSGPALFRQKRYGLNQEPFRIFKFRTMRVMDDGAVVKQATRSDSRITSIGAHLRRLSIDELPQLFNVLIGDMSIVGPRPHALAHDQLYFGKLARYARRHNVKPGITGWAQVHGHRGEIAHDSAMLARLDHDLYYIDHWSIWLDAKIVFLTAFSRRAHANAY